MRFIALAFGLIVSLATPASAEIELSFYLGTQSAPHSRVHGNDPGGVGNFSFGTRWDGDSFGAPPYYGARATWWRTEHLGFGVEFTHAKVLASETTKAAQGFSVLEFTDGLNIVTANVFYRWPSASRWTPYVGAGVGVAIPHAEVTTSGGRTAEYQITGPAVRLVGGISYRLNDSWALFGEYQGTYSQNDVDLNNGGTLKTDIVTNALNVGVAFRF